MTKYAASVLLGSSSAENSASLDGFGETRERQQQSFASALRACRKTGFYIPGFTPNVYFLPYDVP